MESTYSSTAFFHLIMEIQCQEYEETPEFSTVLCRIIVGLEGYTDKIICLLKSKFFKFHSYMNLEKSHVLFFAYDGLIFNTCC